MRWSRLTGLVGVVLMACALVVAPVAAMAHSAAHSAISILQDTPAPPGELNGLWIAGIGAFSAAVFGVVKLISKTVAGFSDTVKAVLGLLGGFAWGYAFKFANAHGLPLPDSLSAFLASMGPVIALVNAAAGMGLRGILKAFGWSQALKSAVAS